MICAYLKIQNFFRIKPYVCVHIYMYMISCISFHFGVADPFFW